MSLNSIDVVVLLFPNEEWTNATADKELDQVVAQVIPNISYSQHLQDNLQTLSAYGLGQISGIKGFLYVPDLDRTDPCFNISKDYVPANVTRQANLPPTDFSLVALAPWINVECTQAYLGAARQDPARGFIFYLPDNDTSRPPPVSSSAWDLQDGGRWKSSNHYSVYAIPGSIGGQLMHELSLYSGNMTDVPYGHEISESPGIDPRDYVRLYAQLGIGGSSTLPNLWVFLLIVAAVLGLMLIATSVSMHLVQRSRRQSLRRRVASGEVNLEALGIKRLTVPQETISELPLFTYNCAADKSPSQSIQPVRNAQPLDQDTAREEFPSAPREISASYGEAIDLMSQPTQNVPQPILSDDTMSNPDSILVHKFLPYSQPTCHFCLEDYISGETTIRELPCGHIFHPECIDIFLSQHSSLCPLCKKSALPVGYCPAEITNSMVRRERNLRRLRSTVVVNDDYAEGQAGDIASRMKNWRSRFHRIILGSNTGPMEEIDRVTNMMPIQQALMTNAIPPARRFSAESNASHIVTRAEIAQQRRHELAVMQVQYPDIADEDRRPKWRKLLAKPFPGFS